jgi:hypothetical protein
MATYDYQLAGPPESARARELWLQHTVGFIVFEDIRRYALKEIDPNLAPEVRQAVQKGIDDAVYGLMMIIDGVTGALSNDSDRVELSIVARHVRKDKNGESAVVINELDLARGDGMCMGYHGWLKGDFGDDPVATPKAE